ncbi:MAG: hypothetical protein ACI4AA_07385 [Lachnospiraceae bacterium]
METENTIYQNSCREMLDFKIVSGDFYQLVKRDNGKYALQYKDCVEILDFPMLTELFPQLAGIRYPLRDKLPYFTTGLSETAGKFYAGEKVAVEGGPCLFGTDEVKIEVIGKNGRKDYFDYNTGKSYVESGEINEKKDFKEFVALHAGEIQAIRFKNSKPALTPQEWAFIKYPFEIAEALSAPLVIPIPDMSYIKYLEAVLEKVDEKVKRDALEEFRMVGYEISDLYLDVIDRMRALHKNVHCDVVHVRDKEICRKYYEERSPHIERKKIIRNLTGIPEKTESIKDYVTMPALPYYLYGIPNVIEVDSMDETDSFRKCRKAHKGKLNLSCILFPELLSKDQTHTIFDAPRDRKEYGHYVVG